MTTSQDVRAAMLNAMPRLRAFAKALCRDPDRADDLIQQTFLQAWSNLDKFEPGSNMVAWLVTILRYRYYSEYRKRRHEIEDVDGIHASGLSIEANQIAHVELADCMDAIDELPGDSRQAIALVGLLGYSYEDAARAANCPVGTLKSRAHRARERLLMNLHRAAGAPVPGRSRPAQQVGAAGPA